MEEIDELWSSLELDGPTETRWNNISPSKHVDYLIYNSLCVTYVENIILNIIFWTFVMNKNLEFDVNIIKIICYC